MNAERMFPIAHRMPYATPIPTSTPTIEVPAEYRLPSNRTSLVSWPRLIPTARAIPISDFRSSANMMKMLRIRTMPARIANELRMRKNMESCFAPLVALSTEIFFSVNAHGIAGGVTAIEGSVLHPVDVEVVVDGVVEYRLFRV